MLKINLVPEVQAKRNELKRLNAAVTTGAIVFLGTLLAIIVVISAINIAKKAELKRIETRIAGLQSEIEQYKELEETVLSLEKGLAAVKSILSGENTWTEFFAHLERITPADVTYKSIKIKENTLEADIEAPNIEAIAKFVDSYKAYQLVVLSGAGTSGEDVSIAIDNGTPIAKKVGADGRWKLATNFDPAVDHTIVIEKGAEKSELKYSAASKKITSENTATSAQVKNLFTAVEASQYEKKDTGITFTVKLTFDKGVLW